MTSPSVTFRRALAYRGATAGLETIERDELGQGDLRVKVLACGVCGSDIEMLAGRAFVGRLPVPVWPGHEVAGRVVEMELGVAQDGAGNTLELGDMVVLHSIGACGSCSNCTSGRDNRCRQARTLGLDHAGGFSDEVVWPAKRSVRVRHVDATRAALLPDAVATAYHALGRAEAPLGGTLAVIGIGGLGAHLLQLAGIVRPDLELVGIGRSERSVQRAESLGSVAIRGLDDAARREAKRLGLFDAVVDVSGADEAIEFGLSTLKRGGRVVATSLHEAGLRTSMTRTTFMTKELELVGAYGSNLAELCIVVNLAESGSLDLLSSVSRMVTLDEFPSVLPGLFERGQGEMRTVVVPDPAELP